MGLGRLVEPGLYPVRPVTKYWYLGQKRKYLVLRIKRQQLPLAPGFAVTAHSSQGKTLDASILDLCIGKDPAGLRFRALIVGRVSFFDIETYFHVIWKLENTTDEWKKENIINVAEKSTNIFLAFYLKNN